MANIKIRSFESDTVFLLLALTRLVRSALFPCYHVTGYFYYLPKYILHLPLIQKAVCKACLDIAFPSQRAELRFSTWLQFRHRLVMAGARSHARVPAALAKAVLSRLHRGLPRARSTWWCRQQPFRASRERQCEEQLWYSLLGGLAGHSLVITWDTKDGEAPSSSRCWLQVEALTSKEWGSRYGSRNPELLVNSN